MALTEIPPTPEAPASGSQLYEVPALIVQLQDDLGRSRLREAFWMSVVVHLVLIISLLTSPKWVNFGKPIAVRTAADLIAGKELTYLDLPHDNQKVEKAPDTNKISDKNRIATTRHPTLDKKTLDDLRASTRPGPPGAPGMPAPQPAPAQAGQQGQQQAQTTPPAPQGGHPQPPPAQTEARLQPPPTPKPFGQFGQMTAGSAIEQAARAAAAGRSSGYGGAGGDYGIPSNSHGQMGSLEILTDTQGVDFAPYLSRVKVAVEKNWYPIIPEVARRPLMKRGIVTLVFYIMKGGDVRGLQIEGHSGDVSLDRAAYGSIVGSNPFPPLPGEFGGPYIALRFRFLYNPDKNDLR